MPPLPRKAGIPLGVEIPAPVKTRMRLEAEIQSDRFFAMQELRIAIFADTLNKTQEPAGL